MTEAGASTEQAKKARPIVPYLKLPEKEGEEAVLVGVRCKACGKAFLGERLVCPNCTAVNRFEPVTFSRTGELYAYTIVYQSAPGIPVPYISAIIDLPEGVSVRANLVDIEPRPENLKFGMKVEMVTRKVREDSEGNDVIAFFFRPAGQ